MRKNYSFANWLRIIGVVLILLCHFTQQSNNHYFVLSSQFFNIGNYVFLILSGMLFGMQGPINNCLLWYKKRLKRIYLPYELFVCSLFVVHIALNKQIDIIQWVMQFLGLQGWNGVEGATHTWFITMLLICYLVTPLLSYLTNRNRTWNIIIICSSLILPIILAYFPVDLTLIIPIPSYFVAYVVGKNIHKVFISRKYFIAAFILMFIQFAFRLLSRFLWDNTIFYTHVVANYTHAIAAFCIIYMVYCIFRKDTPKIISYLSGISFEIYLWHYMFTDGPVRLFGISSVWFVDCIIVLTITIIISIFAFQIISIPKKMKRDK